MTRPQVTAIFLEYIRPELSRIAGFPVDMVEVNGSTIVGDYPHCILASRIFGGFCRAVDLDVPEAVMNDARQFENIMTARILGTLKELEAEADSRAIVNYRWPAA